MFRLLQGISAGSGDLSTSDKILPYRTESLCHVVKVALNSHSRLMNVASRGICGSELAQFQGGNRWKKQKARRPRRRRLCAANTPKPISKSCGPTRKCGRQ